MEEELNVLGRKHSAQDAAETADQIRKAGIYNISLDLMVGVSKQTKESLQKSIDFCAHIQAEHISAYLLKIEPGTVYEKEKQNSPCLTTTSRASYTLLCVTLLRHWDTGSMRYRTFQNQEKKAGIT